MNRNDDPRTFHIGNDKEGFFIEDDDGEEVTHWQNWPAPSRRFSSCRAAEQELTSMVNNWEPPDGPGWEGGFAANH